jgi:hypothetical protein
VQPPSQRQPRRSAGEKRQARAELRAVRDALDGLAYHDQAGEVKFVGQRHGTASGVDLREAWTATSRLDELASSRDAKMEELEHAHARAVGNLSNAKEHLAQAARRLATERAAANRTSATYRGGSPYRSPSRETPATTAVEAAMDDALHSAKAVLAAAGGDFRSTATTKRSPNHRSAWGPSSAEAVRGRVGSRVRAAEVAAQAAAHRARESRHQAQNERMTAQQPMRELEEWLDVQPAIAPIEELTMSSSTAVGRTNRRASEEPQALQETKTRPGQSVRPASQSIVSSGASAAVGMDLQPRSSSPSNSRAARSRTRLSGKSAAAGSEVSSAVVWGSVTRHMTAVHTHRRRAAAAAVRKCPPSARKLLAAALYRCPAVHPPIRPHSPNLREANRGKKNTNLERQFAHATHETHPNEGRRISRSEFRAACAAVVPRHTALAHNLSTTTIDTLTEW